MAQKGGDNGLMSVSAGAWPVGGCWKDRPTSAQGSSRSNRPVDDFGLCDRFGVTRQREVARSPGMSRLASGVWDAPKSAPASPVFPRLGGAGADLVLQRAVAARLLPA